MENSMRRLALVVLAALTLSGCGTYRPLKPDDAPRLNEVFQERMRADDELRGDVVNVDRVWVRGDGRGLEGVVILNGKAWADKLRTQQDRLIRKIGSHMQGSLYSLQRDHPRSTFTLHVVNDIKEEFGFIIIVGGSNDQGVVYNVRR